MSDDWIQIKGDPSIRKFLFDQERTNNEFDYHIDDALACVTNLMTDYGVFHSKLHFSSGQVTLWFIDDPLRYRVYIKDDFLVMNVKSTFARRQYPSEAILDASVIKPVFQGFKQLRTHDPQVYLRSGSLNVVNGIVGLNFSCDGSHYMHTKDFLAKVDEMC